MIDPAAFCHSLEKNSVSLFTGVPDSLLKDFAWWVEKNLPSSKHIITPNEGNAVALAAGHYLATKELALVYLQNSGLGNTVNPLTSLADPAVYGIPLLLLIGWRGEPGVSDEPQHAKMGLINNALLDTLGIDYFILSPSEAEWPEQIALAAKTAYAKCAPFALVVRKDTFAPYKASKDATILPLDRELALIKTLEKLWGHYCIVATTGHLSRELYALRQASGQDGGRDFLTVGSMGHCSHLALGIALGQPQRPVFCFDGDGSLLMHMGALGLIGSRSPENFYHICFNNGAHNSVGGQKTIGHQIDFSAIAKACLYKHVEVIRTESELENFLNYFPQLKGPVFIDLHVNTKSRADLPRPKDKPQVSMQRFMDFLSQS